jgi:hypothetical protein
MYSNLRKKRPVQNIIFVPPIKTYSLALQPSSPFLKFSESFWEISDHPRSCTIRGQHETTVANVYAPGSIRTQDPSVRTTYDHAVARISKQVYNMNVDENEVRIKLVLRSKTLVYKIATFSRSPYAKKIYYVIRYSCVYYRCKEMFTVRLTVNHNLSIMNGTCCRWFT